MSVDRTADLLRVARQRLLAYTIAMMPTYRVGRHHRILAGKLEGIIDGSVKRLMVTMPPRHGKSELCAGRFPAFFLGHFPEEHIIYGTYSGELSSDWGRQVRNQLADPMYQRIFPDVCLADDSRASDRFSTNHEGKYVAIGVGGTATGRGADLFVIDDPHKDREEADSAIMRKKVRDWYTSTVHTRLHPGAAIIIIQTRWHENDLAGWLLEEAKEGGEAWDLVEMPAIANENQTDRQGRSLEVALWPEQYDLEWLRAKRRTIGARDWLALYQQRPRPPGGGEFKREWIQFYSSVGKALGMNKYILVDPAGERREDPDNDYTSIWCIGLAADRNYYVLDMVRDRLNLTQRASAVFRMHQKWKPLEVRYEEYGLQSDIGHLKAEMERTQYRFKVVKVGGRLAKNDRIRRLLPMFSENRFWFPNVFWYTNSEGHQVDLVKAFIEEEYLPFPVSRHDDMFDALARIEQPEPEFALKWPAPSDDATIPGYGQPLDPVAGF